MTSPGHVTPGKAMPGKAMPGKAASVVRRLGMGVVDRLGPLKNKLNAAARGNSGDLPKLLLGEAL